MERRFSRPVRRRERQFQPSGNQVGVRSRAADLAYGRSRVAGRLPRQLSGLARQQRRPLQVQQPRPAASTTASAAAVFAAAAAATAKPVLS